MTTVHSIPGSHTEVQADAPTGGRARPGLAVAAATVLFFAVCLGFLINTPSGIAPDEIYQFDRVIAASHGQVVLDPEEINVSTGARAYQATFVPTMMWAGTASWAEHLPLLRDARPSLADLGGNQRSLDQDVSNYMTQHPPLYYALMGGLKWLIPGAEEMPADTLFLLLRFFNVMFLLPLPVLFWYGTRLLVGNSAVAAAAAFLPLLVPGMARIAASINNDNLAVPLGAALIALCIKVMLGDLGARTAALICAVAIAGSLTKGTIVFLLVVIPVAYLIGAIQQRRWPTWPAFGILGMGALAAAAWWVRNLVLFGTLQPSATGTMTAAAAGPVRPSDVPIDMGYFWYKVAVHIPSRFFGSLGLLEPPELPRAMILLLTGLVLVCIPIAVVALRGRRWVMATVVALPFVELAALLYKVYQHFTQYLILPGLQGRYLYPAAFGLLVPIAIVVGLMLGRRRRWAPLVIAVPGLFVCGWALYISVDYTWLPRKETLTPSNWVQAFKTLAGFSALPGPVTVTLTLLLAALVAAGVVMAFLACRRSPWELWPTLVGHGPKLAVPAPSSSEPLGATAARPSVSGTTHDDRAAKSGVRDGDSLVADIEDAGSEGQPAGHSSSAVSGLNSRPSGGTRDSADENGSARSE